MLSPNSFVNDLKFYPAKHIQLLVLILAILVTLSLFKSISSSQDTVLLPVELHSIEKTQPPLAGKVFLPEAPSFQEPHKENVSWKRITVRSGDNLAKIFQRMKLSDTLLANLLVKAPKAEKKSLLKLLPGETFQFGFNQEQLLKHIRYHLNPLEHIKIDIDESGFSFDTVLRSPDVRLAYKRATVKDSLFLSAMRADINDNLTMEIANIFGGVIDFALDVRSGDSFDVLYETLFLDEKMIEIGNILAVSYTNDGTTHTAFRYKDAEGKTGYFDENGVSMRKPFLRAPLDFTRISSNFNLRRMHPVHKKIKAHRGTDYAAPRGTPIFAAGDGRVTRSGFSKANGNYVIIQHGQHYMTKYLHLHKRQVKTGQRVSQRQIIGTVGSTGYSTGPHLHYEFLVNGVHRNPRTILKKLPSADPIKASEMDRFLEQIKAVQLQYSNYQAQVF